MFELGIQSAIPGSRVAWQIEIDEYCLRVLAHHWPNTPRFKDVRTVETHHLERVDVIVGGFPCTDTSDTGQREGMLGASSGLWWEMWRIIRDLRPRWVCVENTTGLYHRGLGEVAGSLAALRYDLEWCRLSAQECGAPHRRERIFMVADSNGMRHEEQPTRGLLEEPQDESRHDAARRCASNRFQLDPWRDIEAPQPSLRRVDHGDPDRLARNRRWRDEIRSLGNSIVPQCSYVVGQRLAQLAGLDSQGRAKPGR